jgi:3-isopropylmalate/(R)-2-methylmalate dehydratase small subunit
MGKAWVFGSDMNTDEIIPARFNQTTDGVELAKKVFCEVRPEFAGQVLPGDVIVAGKNFGCGSSREHAPIAIKASGVACVIAPSFARIFFRNALNIGLVILESEQAVTSITEGDEVIVVPETGEIVNTTKNETYKARSLPAFVLQIVKAGGIIPFLQDHDMDELL